VTGAAVSPPPALERALDLFDPARRPAEPDVSPGYLNLLGDEDPTGSHPGQRLMASRLLPLVYERVWRPTGGHILIGMREGMAGEQRIALEMLGCKDGDRVLDVGCGPGNFSRAFAREVGESGLVVGLDASRTMLAKGVAEDNPRNVAYVLGDATALPFRDSSFDAVCCFAALHLFAEPFLALDHMARVLTPGGRVAIFTTGPAPIDHLDADVVRVSHNLARRDLLREELARVDADTYLVEIKAAGIDVVAEHALAHGARVVLADNEVVAPGLDEAILALVPQAVRV